LVSQGRGHPRTIAHEPILALIWIDPENFWSALGFLIIWITLSIIGCLYIRKGITALIKAFSDNSDTIGGCGGCALMIVTHIGSGILAWNWTDPENFWDVFWFLFIWGILNMIGYTILWCIMAVWRALFGNNEQ
jgi:hypothetical protein